MSIKIPVEQALEELEKYVNDIVSIDDLKEYIKTNRADFIKKWGMVNQFYKYIIYHTDELDDNVIKAIDLISDLAARQVLLGKLVNMMLEPKKINDQVSSNDLIESDIEYIEALTAEVQNMPQWEINRVIYIKQKLNEYQERIMANRAYFEVDVYESLMESVCTALAKIDRINGIFNLNSSQDTIKR